MTKFTNNVLRHVVKNVNIQNKALSISMNGLNIVSRLGISQSQGLIEHKSYVEELPDIYSFDNNMGDDLLPKNMKKINKTLGKLPRLKPESGKILSNITEDDEITEADKIN